MSGGLEGERRAVRRHGRHRLVELSAGSDTGVRAGRRHQALEAAGVGTWHLGPTDRWIGGWNREMFHLFDVDPDDGDAVQTAWRRIDPRCRWSHEKCLGKAKRTGWLDDVVRIQTASGQTRWLRFRGRRLGEGDAEVHGICQDVTDQQATEAELRDARRAAEEANRAKDQFLANMSHEIRSPITTILGYCEVLSECLPNTSPAEYLETIHRNGLHLLDLINDLLDTSRIESGQMALCIGPVHLPTEMRTVLGPMRSHAEEKGLELKVEAGEPLPETIQSDARRLRQILINLISNAIKFTDQGQITVRVAADRASQTLRFEVVDTGVGISEADQQRLFEPFTQTEAAAGREQEGTGLGLCISRRLARMLGGDVVLSSRPGSGSTFTVTLATGSLDQVRLIDLPQELASPVPQQPTSCQALPYRVLIVEDRSDMRLLIRRLLEKAGAKVSEAGNGQQGLDLAVEAMERSEPFDAVLIDIQMPVLDGFEASRRLRKARYVGPVIALTAHAMPDDPQRCHDAGCSGYLAKPIDHRVLLDTLQRQIRRWPANK